MTCVIFYYDYKGTLSSHYEVFLYLYKMYGWTNLFVILKYKLFSIDNVKSAVIFNLRYIGDDGICKYK